ncbi:MAG: hypothetical protein WED05_02395 [Candidatus Atabeyarchaeum deiterrae]
MSRSKKIPALLILLTITLFALPVSSSRAQSEMIYIYYVQTSPAVYEIGEQVNASAAWYVDYGGGTQCSEGAISIYNDSSSTSALAFQRWENEPQGHCVHQTFLLLNPNDWSPGENGQNGVAKASLSLPLGNDEHLSQNVTFVVTRARQNCSLIAVTSTQPPRDLNSVSILFRVYNRNNSSFGVGLNPVEYSIIDPLNRTIVADNVTFSNANGDFRITFNPNFMSGKYTVSLTSSGSSRYLEGRFSFMLSVWELCIVDVASIPQIVSFDHNYSAKYIFLDSLSKIPVSNVTVTIRINGFLLISGITDCDGAVILGIRISKDRCRAGENSTLLIQAFTVSSEGICYCYSNNRTLVCKVGTATVLRVSQQGILESGETILLSAQLLSLNSTPIEGGCLIFAEFENRESNPTNRYTKETDAEGICTVLLKTSNPGVFTIIVSFEGNNTYDSSNETCSFLVLPTSQERFFSSVPVTALTVIFSVILSLKAMKARRKVKWRELIIREV